MPSISIDDASVTEGSAATTDATFTVSLSAASDQTVTVDYATTDGSAEQPADYLPASGTLSFAPGETSKTITVQVKGDTLDENDEGYTVGLSSPANATLSDAGGAGTITNDDSPVSIQIDDIGMTEGDSGTATATFTVSLSAESGKTITIDYATADAGATQPADYQQTTGTLTFTAGQTSKTIDVPVAGDTLDEPDETFAVNLTNASGVTLLDGHGVATISDDDAAPTIAIDDATLSEGNTGTASAAFNVSLSAPSGKTITVGYATADGSATQPADYTQTSGTLTFTAGQTTKTILVAVKGDTLDEADEGYTVGLSGPTNATLADATGAGTITDDDGPPQISVDDATVTEGNGGTVTANFTVSLSAASAKTITVDYATADGTATQPADYTQTSGTLTFAPGETTKTSPSRSRATRSTRPTRATRSTSPIRRTRRSRTPAAPARSPTTTARPSLSTGNATVTEGDAGTTDASFTVTLSAASGKTVTVDYATADVTAAQPADYTQTAGTLTFTHGQTSKTVTVAVKGDTLDETDETFQVNLSAPVGASISDGQGLGTITDDDAPVSASIGDAPLTEGNTGTANATFTVSLSAASGKTVTVDYATADGTATQPADYTPDQRHAHLHPRPDQQDDHASRSRATRSTSPTRGYTVNLSARPTRRSPTATGAGTITDDDSARRRIDRRRRASRGQRRDGERHVHGHACRRRAARR